MAHSSAVDCHENHGVRRPVKDTSFTTRSHPERGLLVLTSRREGRESAPAQETVAYNSGLLGGDLEIMATGGSDSGLTVSGWPAGSET